MSEKEPQYELERDGFVKYIESQLIGPADGETEELHEAPTLRYLTGVLFPPDAEVAACTADEESDDSADVEDNDNPISLAFERLPGSAGISFFIEGEGGFTADISAGVYAKQQGSKCWQRQQLCERDICFRRTSTSGTERRNCFGDRAALHVMWRKLSDGYLVTATVVNARKKTENGLANPEDCMFQLGLCCRPTDGKILEYRGLPTTAFDEEERMLELLYRARPTLAVGHGCAATWNCAGPDRTVESVSLSFIPRAVVPEMPPTSAQSEVLSLQRLSEPTLDPKKLKADLLDFVKQYSLWIQKIELASLALDARFASAAKSVVERLQSACSRMVEGIDALIESKDAMRAFRLANRAMLMQMVHSQEEFGGGTRNLHESPFIQPDYSAPKWSSFRWRPFQLAFQLLALPSLIDARNVHRKTVDLIWFATGGGKTEAYLGLAAFEMFRRRITNGAAGEGTAIIKRYTLRLLTSQQFQRAASLMCACEQLRRADPTLGGPFRLGLWVGDGATPNRLSDDTSRTGGAAQQLETLLTEDEPENPFQLSKCPWCGTRLIPARRSTSEHYGIEVTSTAFKMFCPSLDCLFHDELPVSVVDEDLYTRPPSFLVATVDKFARLAWDPRPGVFFGVGTNARPPSLIIQDELHLISGPLGTIAGAYEAAIDTIVGTLGEPPKIIAATATIRRADEQVKRLYGRPVAVFPPSGLDADDSYFARVDHSKPGRMYLGVMGSGHTPVTSLVRTAAALAQGAVEAPLSDECRDGYWTQLIYHNSRRELGKTLTLAVDDIPQRVSVISRGRPNHRSLEAVVELSATVPGKQIPAVLDRLSRRLQDGDPIDILPCTNMLSVGVDVKRLGLMLINGQPKTTSEYIQASSRIGRHRVPGLIVTLYSPTKPRDRSHYEGFVGYHSSLYRWVEPTSVTPWAEPARERTLHAALVALMRHAGGLPNNEDATRFDRSSSQVMKLVNAIVDRVRLADPLEADATRIHLEQRMQEWSDYILSSKGAARPLRYDSNGSKQFDTLLCQFGDGGSGLWQTLNSMRHVDANCLIHVEGERR